MLSGCGVLDYMFLPAPEDTVQEIYENARTAMQDKYYKAAIEGYTKIKESYPFSPYALEAELSLGDAYFMAEKYQEASEAYQEFESLHPRHPSIPYVLYQIGMSELKSFTSLDRPTTMVYKAQEYFHRVQEQFPESEQAIHAAEQITACRKILAEHELFVAEMYWHMEKYGAAYERYLYVIKNYPDVPSVVEFAQKQSNTVYYLDKEQRAEEERRKIKGHWRDWFKWL